MDGGKTNTSGLSHGSNTSGMSTSGQVRATKGGENHEPTQQVFQFSATDATPVVRRNKKPAPNTETKAFSASKKYVCDNSFTQANWEESSTLFK